jgi:ariadne-1
MPLELDAPRVSVNRSSHYQYRYSNHLQSLTLERKLTKLVENREEFFIELGVLKTHIELLSKAIETLLQCRHTLIYTYIFAFYLKPNDNQTVIFEQNQSDLELSVEKLSNHLDWAANISYREEFSVDFLNVFKYCEQRRQTLLDHVQEGFENDYWSFQEDNA